MSFLSGIFKKKAGGTAVGNIIRSVVGGALKGSAAGEVIATGQYVATQKDIDRAKLTDVEFYSRYAETKAGVVLPQYGPVQQLQPVVPVDNTVNEIKTVLAKNWLKENWKLVTGIVVALGVLIFFAFRKKRSSYKR